MKGTIVFLINSKYPYYSGGRENWLYNVSEILCSYFDIIVVSHKQENEMSHFENINSSVKFVKVATLKNIPILGKLMRHYLSVIDNLYGAWEMYKVCRRLDKEFSPVAFISSDTVYTPIPIRALKKKNSKIRFICNVKGLHAEDLSSKLGLLKRFFYNQEILSLSKADRIWTNGYDTQNYVNALGFESKMVGNGINLAKIDNSEESPDEDIYNKESFKICSIGTLRDIKGVKELIEAGRRIKERGYTEFDIIFVGKGNPKKYIEYAKLNGIDDKVHFLGEKKNVIPYLKKSDILTCLSGGGGMSMAALESLASKTPVVAWNSQIYKQIIIHNSTGYLVKEWDSDDLASGLINVMSNIEEYKEKAFLARESVTIYDWINITNKIVDEINGIKI